MVQLPSFRILFDSLLSTAQSLFHTDPPHHSSLALIPLSNYIFCTMDLSIIPLYLKSFSSSSHSKPHLLLQRPSFSSVLLGASLQLHVSSGVSVVSSLFFSFLLLFLFTAYFFSGEVDLVLMLTSYHRLEGDMNIYRLGKGLLPTANKESVFLQFPPILLP